MNAMEHRIMKYKPTKLFLITKQGKRIELLLNTMEFDTELPRFPKVGGLKWWFGINIYTMEFRKLQKQWQHLVEENKEELKVNFEYYPGCPDDEGKYHVMKGKAEMGGVSYGMQYKDEIPTANIHFNGVGKITWEESKLN